MTREGLKPGRGETVGLDAKRESPVPSGTRPNPCFSTPNPILEGVELREAYARIISPEWFGEKDGVHVLDNRPGQHLEYQARALAKADAILALKATPLIGLSQGEGERLADLIRDRDGENFDGEIHLTSAEGEAIVAALSTVQDGSVREALEGAAVNQNDVMRQELANVGNLVSDLARAMGVDQANADGTWPDLAGRIQKLTEAALSALPQSGDKI